MTGPYAHVRHPQYVGFIAIVFGFLLQWPTLVTLVMFPILVTVYMRPARREEREVRVEFGSLWDAYAARTPAVLPHVWRSGRAAGAPPRSLTAEFARSQDPAPLHLSTAVRSSWDGPLPDRRDTASGPPECSAPVH